MSDANRLASERSPYLLQHAHNPVDWYPWGDEAFERAARENRPVFLSIGYSACHWCHVMERESFEDDDTARFLNERFVSVKVDREERPDIDQIYQLAHQILTQRGGGWPLSVFLTPDKRPFYAGTYFPNARRYGMPSFRDVLAALHEAFVNKRSDVNEQAGELTRILSSVSAAPVGSVAPLDRAHLDRAVVSVLRRAEPTYGGFGRAPKFPNTMTLDLLFASAATSGNAQAREHVLLTLDRMARGGIYDRLGGGFARYSTDERWLIPHFEKMLYDNAQLVRAYVDGWRTLGDGRGGPIDRPRAERTIRETVTYLLREMRDETGAFYSAQDADSEGVEGKFFAWTPAEIETVLGERDASVVCRVLDVTAEGNFEHGKSVLWLPRPLEEAASAVGLSVAELDAVLARARTALFEARERRVKPFRDEKCLASWNALAISALADAGATLAVPAWIDVAREALKTWQSRAWTQGRLAHAMKHGEVYGDGFLDDLAGLACAALDVYEATFDADALAFARALVDAAIDRFWDDAEGVFYYVPADAEVVLQRAKEVHDHAYPGGVGLVADALLRLATLTGALRYRGHAERMLGSLVEASRENPLGLGTVVRAIDRAARGAVEIVVMGDPDDARTREMLHAARSVYLPHRTLVCAKTADDGVRQGLDRALMEGRATGPDFAPRVYVCRGTVCEAPVDDAAALLASLRRAVAA